MLDLCDCNQVVRFDFKSHYKLFNNLLQFTIVIHISV